MLELATGLTAARLARELDSLAAQSQLRGLSLPQGLDLMSNDYLGLAQDPRLRGAVANAISEGAAMASSGSRLLSGNARVWEEVEEEFAAFVGAEAALFFASGYSANLGVLASVLRAEDHVFSDQSNHASLIDGIRLSRAQKTVFPHLNLNALEDGLRDSAAESGEKLIVIESLFSMEGDRAPLPQVAELAARYGAELMVDEAHATGVCGPEGRGLLAACGLSRFPLAAIFPCGKALASCGAFVACSSTMKRYLVNCARTFIFSTALPPYLAYQIRAAIALAREAEEQRRHVQTLASALRSRIRKAGLNADASDSHIVPVIYGGNRSAQEAASRLERAGFAIRPIRPPTVPPGTARLRISVNARLSMQDMDRLEAALQPQGTIAQGAFKRS